MVRYFIWFFQYFCNKIVEKTIWVIKKKRSFYSISIYFIYRTEFISIYPFFLLGRKHEWGAGRAFFFFLRKTRWCCTRTILSRVYLSHESLDSRSYVFRFAQEESKYPYYFLSSWTNAQCDAVVSLKSIIKKSWWITILFTCTVCTYRPVTCIFSGV